jgi:hypothetical protein
MHKVEHKYTETYVNCNMTKVYFKYNSYIRFELQVAYELQKQEPVLKPVYIM